MNQRAMSDIEMSLLSEARRLERALKSRAAKVASLERKIDPEQSLLNYRPRRYSIELDFTPGVLQPQSKAFAVDGGTTFLVDKVDTSFRITGRAAAFDGIAGLVPGQVTSVTLGYGNSVQTSGGLAYRQYFFDFFWEIRDNGADREFQNLPMPSTFLMGGSLSGALLPISGKLAGGSAVQVTIDPATSEVSDGVNPLGIFFDVQKYTLHVSFDGYEVTT